MLAILVEPFPASGEGVLTDEELAADLAKMRQQIGPAPAAPIAFPERPASSRPMALAAGIVIAIAIATVVVWKFNSEPRMVSTKVLFADGSRGVTRGGPEQPPAQLSTKIDYELELLHDEGRQSDEYRVEFYDVSSEPPRRLWTREHVRQQHGNRLPVRVETDDLEPGLYRLVLEGKNNEKLAEYTMRLSSP